MIRRLCAVLAVPFFAMIAACVAETSPSDDGLAESSGSVTSDGSIGSSCTSDASCDSGVCFSAHDYQAYWPWCYGTVCTVECEERVDDVYCQQVAEDAGSAYAEYAYCANVNGRGVCELFAAGLGSFGCE